MSIIVQAMELLTAYFCESSFEPFNFNTYKGVWRSVCLYQTTDGLLVITIVYRPEELDSVQIDGMKKTLLNFFTDGHGRKCGAASVFLQDEATLQGTLIIGEQLLYTEVLFIIMENFQCFFENLCTFHVLISFVSYLS